MNEQKVIIVFRFKPQPGTVYELVFAEPGVDIEHSQVFTFMPVAPEPPLLELNTSNVTFQNIN